MKRCSGQAKGCAALIDIKLSGADPRKVVWCAKPEILSMPQAFEHPVILGKNLPRSTKRKRLVAVRSADRTADSSTDVFPNFRARKPCLSGPPRTRVQIAQYRVAGYKQQVATRSGESHHRRF